MKKLYWCTHCKGRQYRERAKDKDGKIIKTVYVCHNCKTRI